MFNRILPGQELKMIERDIANEVTDCEFWGDLELTREEFDYLSDSIRKRIESAYSKMPFLWLNYPHAITTYMVFFAVYKYNKNFWGAISEDLNTTVPVEYQRELGLCAQKMFRKYKMDFSEVKDETRIYIAPILYEACIPPDSNLDDLFYILKYDSYQEFDPQLMIEELISMRSFSIRKPLLRFIKRFKDDRAVDYLLEVRDSMLATEQNSSRYTRFSDNYLEWIAQEKDRTYASNRRKNKDFQSNPYLYFDYGKKGLCMVLPRIVLGSEWIEEIVWKISANGFYKEIRSDVIGDQGIRYAESILVSVEPAESYSISLDDSDVDEDSEKEWQVDGIKKDGVVVFNSKGRQISSRYLLYPFGIFILPDTVDILGSEYINALEQYYPNNNDNYRIISMYPLSPEAKIAFKGSTGKEFTYVCKPRIDMKLEGKTPFSIDPEYLSAYVFTETPTLKIHIEGKMLDDDLILKFEDQHFPVKLDENNECIFSLKAVEMEQSLRYGKYSLRLYQSGRFLKQIEYCLIPIIKSNYKKQIYWPDLRERKSSLEYTFGRIEGWEMSFPGCSVRFDEENYVVEVPSSMGELSLGLKLRHDDYGFEYSFNLPVRPIELKMMDSEGNEIDNNTDHPHVIGYEELLEGEYWLSVSAYGSFRNRNYWVRLISVNGVEQSIYLRKSENGSGNMNLMAFYDTIRNIALPAEIQIICDDDDQMTLPAIHVVDKVDLNEKVSYWQGDEDGFILLGNNDLVDRIKVLRFGFDNKCYDLDYSGRVDDDNGVHYRGYNYEGVLSEGIYLIDSNIDYSLFEFEDEMIDVRLSNSIFLVSCRGKDQKRITTSKHVIDLLVKDCIKTGNKKSLDNTNSYNLFKNYINNMQKVELDDRDIEKLVALAYFANDKILKRKRDMIRHYMRKISVHFLQRGDRYRIIELLVKLHAPQEVFDVCLNDYSLLLVHSTSSNVVEIASYVENYSLELSLLLLMDADAPIKDCIWREKYRNLIGKDSIRYMLHVPNAESNEEIANEWKRFMSEMPGSSVVVRLGEEISGKEEEIQKMLVFDQWYNARLDLRKKPDYGLYFDYIRYVDQFVNWYKNTHDENGEMRQKINDRMRMAIDSYSDQIITITNELKNDLRLGRTMKQYEKVISARKHDGVDFSSNQWFFYIEGLAAFIAKLPVDRKNLDPQRSVGIKFMSIANLVAPRLSKRDILMAKTFIYLKRKEASLCQ